MWTTLLAAWVQAVLEREGMARDRQHWDTFASADQP
jgi:hypothetical protein